MTTIVGFDVIDVNGVTITSLANEDSCKVTFPNDSIEMYKGGGNGVAFKADADIAEVEIHIFKATKSDQYVAGLQHDQRALKEQFTPMLASITKKYSGGIQEKVTLKDGFFTSTQPELTTSFSGSVDGIVAIYKIKFISSERVYI